MPDVLRSWLGSRHTSRDDLAAIEAGSTAWVVCIPVVDGRPGRRSLIGVSLAPGFDWSEVFGSPPYRVTEVRRPSMLAADQLAEIAGSSATGDWTVRVPSADVSIVRMVLARVTAIAAADLRLERVAESSLPWAVRRFARRRRRSDPNALCAYATYNRVRGYPGPRGWDVMTIVIDGRSRGSLHQLDRGPTWTPLTPGEHTVEVRAVGRTLVRDGFTLGTDEQALLVIHPRELWPFSGRPPSARLAITTSKTTDARLP